MRWSTRKSRTSRIISIWRMEKSRVGKKRSTKSKSPSKDLKSAEDNLADIEDAAAEPLGFEAL